MSLSQDEFRRALLETVAKILDEVLGPKVAAALRFYVDLKSALTNPDRFFAVMISLVGPRHAEHLRERTLQTLYGRYGLVYQRTEGKFSDAIAVLRSKIIDKDPRL